MNKNTIQQTTRFLETADLIKSRMKPNSRIIEIGASDASFKDTVVIEHENISWLTVDKYGNPDIQGDLNGRTAHIPVEDESIDIVICTEVLEHLTLGSYLVKEINRVLKKEGCAIISVPNIVSLKSRIQILFGILSGHAASGDCGPQLGGTGYLVDGEWVGGHVIDFNYKRLSLYLERGGLKISQHCPISIEINFKGTNIFHLPRFLSPKNLSDFILVVAQNSK
jgi:SAM-dependent methyltransferase